MYFLWKLEIKKYFKIKCIYKAKFCEERENPNDVPCGILCLNIDDDDDPREDEGDT